MLYSFHCAESSTNELEGYSQNVLRVSHFLTAEIKYLAVRKSKSEIKILFERSLYRTTLIGVTLADKKYYPLASHSMRNCRFKVLLKKICVHSP